MTDVSMPMPLRRTFTWFATCYAAFARRDIAAILAVLSPEVDWGEPDNPLNPSAGTRHGHEGFLEWVRTGNQAEEVLALEPRQFLVGADTVAVVGAHVLPRQVNRQDLRNRFCPCGHLQTGTDRTLPGVL